MMYSNQQNTLETHSDCPSMLLHCQQVLPTSSCSSKNTVTASLEKSVVEPHGSQQSSPPCLRKDHLCVQL